MIKVYLTNRNLRVLLSKLDRVKAGDSSACTIIKRDTVHEKYPQSHKMIEVIAKEDSFHITSKVKDKDTAEIYITRAQINHLLKNLESTDIYDGILDFGVNCKIIAIDDDEYYISGKRDPGSIHLLDEPDRTFKN